MPIVDAIRFGPFTADYHRSLVNDDFKVALERFFERELIPQLDNPILSADGAFTATFDEDRYCGPRSLVRDIFSLELSLVDDGGTSDLESDVVFNPKSNSFTPRTGHGHYFYLWTPIRKRQREQELESIQRVVDDIQGNRTHSVLCPICAGTLSTINNADIFVVRCANGRCFQYDYHKDEAGRLAHGHFFTKHPDDRAEL